MRHILILLLALVPGAAAAQQIDTLGLRAHTRFLSDDALQGRGTGTAGERTAGLYIESELIRMGLRGAANGSYRQRVPIRRGVIDDARSTLRITRNGDAQTFAHDIDFIYNTGGPQAFRDFNGPAVFLGTPDHALRSRANIANRVVVLTATPSAAATRLVPEWKRQGVRGVVVLVPDPAQFALYTRSRGDSRYFVDAPVDDPIWQSDLPVILAGPNATRLLLRDAGNRLERLSAETFEPLDLNATIATTLGMQVESATGDNIVGVVRGTDPQLRDEYIVYTAHYDHLGISTAVAGDSIYNGFSDNAAGVAMLLGIADHFVKHPPKRSVAFVFFTGEERGLLGSTYWASHPPIPNDRVASVINLDAGAPPAPAVEWRIAGGGNSTLGAIAEEVGRKHGWSVILGEASPNSDYWPFLARNVPAIFIIPGNKWENLSDAERDALRQRWDRYHRADDHWDADFPFSGLERYARFALEVGQTAANAQQRPRIERRTSR